MAGPVDPLGYSLLFARIAAATSRESLLAVVPEVIAFEGDRFRSDFAHLWMREWSRRNFGPVPLDAWPPPKSSR